MDDAIVEPSFREQLGGRWAISLKAFLISAPIAVVLVIGWSGSNGSDALGWVLAALVGIVLTGVWVYAMHRTVYRNRAQRPVAVWIGITFAIITAVIFVLSLYMVGRILDLDINQGPLSHTPELLILMPWWSITVILLLEASARFDAQRSVLVERMVQQRVAAMQEAEIAERIRESVRQEIADELLLSRTSIDRHLAATAEGLPADFGLTAAELRQTAQRTVRPLSHRLAERTSHDYPKPGLGTILANIIRRQPLRPVVVSGIYLLAGAPGQIREVGWQRGLLTALLTVSLITITMSLANLAMRRWPRHHAPLFIAGIALVQAPTILLAPAYAQITNTPLSWGEVAASVILGTFIILITSGFGSWRTSRNDMLRTFASDVNENDVATIARSRALARATRDAASILHGAVQTKLVACAIAVEHAADAGDITGVNQALVQARAILDQPIPNWQPADDHSIEDIIQVKASLWRGLANVTVSIDPAIAQRQGALANDVGAIVEEGIANAIQHGSASTIGVELTQRDDAVIISITDDGTGPGHGPAALGSQLLDRITTHWSLEPMPQGARLVAVLPANTDQPAKTEPKVWA